MIAMVTGTSKSHQRVPPKALQLARCLKTHCCSNCSKIDSLDQLLSNRREARTLSQTRDILLPKLISGEIRVRTLKESTGRDGKRKFADSRKA